MDREMSRSLECGFFASELGHEETAMISEELECAWTYVGRFMWRFAEVEWQVNEIFVNVFDLNEGASLMVVGYLDFGKKLQLIDVGLRNQGVDHSDIIKRLRKLADVRNIVAHFPFSESLTSKEAVDFTYINRRGEQRMPWQSEEFGDSDHVCSIQLLRC